MDNKQPFYYTAPEQPRKSHTLVIVLSIVGAILVFLILAAILASSAGGDNAKPNGEHIGVLHIEGTISSTSDTSLLYASNAVYSQEYVLSSIAEMKDNPQNVGILLYIDSPGGEIYATDEVYSALLNYKEETGRPVFAYLASTAASGGYYLAVAADHIAANRMTLTGSIGVTYGSHIDLSGLCEKLGVKVEDITSGANKAMGSYFSPLTEEQKEIYQSQLTEYEQHFIDVIVAGRGMTEEAVRTLADGRTYTANQAKALGLIDEIKTLDECKRDLAEAIGIPDVSFFDYAFTVDVEELLYSLGYSGVDKAPASEIEAILAALKPLSGPLVYYSGR